MYKARLGSELHLSSGHSYTGHNYTGHNYFGHNYIYIRPAWGQSFTFHQVSGQMPLRLAVFAQHTLTHHFLGETPHATLLDLLPTDALANPTVVSEPCNFCQRLIEREKGKKDHHVRGELDYTLFVTPDPLRTWRKPKLLEVTIESASDIAAMDANGLSDPYVRIKVGHQPHVQTKVIDATLDPEWP